MITTPSTIPVPRLPESAPRTPFPVLATVAPVAAAIALWIFTRSPFVLVFAFLGPVVAVASLGDSLRRTRSQARRERRRFDNELVRAIHALDTAHDEDRKLLAQDAPSAASLTARCERDVERWQAAATGPLTVRLGSGRVRTSTPLHGERPVFDSSRQAQALEDLFERAGTLEGAPITVDSRAGVGVFGPRAQVAGILNALIVQLAFSLSPLDFELEVEGASREFAWTSALPHVSARRALPRGAETEHSTGTSRAAFRPRDGGAAIVVAGASAEGSLPLECRVLVCVAGTSGRIVARHDDSPATEFSPEFLSGSQCAAFSDVLTRAAASLPLAPQRALPESVSLESLHQPASGGSAALPACIGVGNDGGVIVDLAADGPHAIVGGTTGSGKSELLVTWIRALAQSHAPDEVNFLLIDFKGGAAFAAVADLPHTVGVLTDLDEAGARRAILSLTAELRRRERILSEAHSRSIEELEPPATLARLVIVVDEFATLTAQLPELHELFGDLAARGRSLGIHLILCTQRPAASVRDAVLANCSLRLSLRVTSQSDSVAVIGTPDAAQLPRHWLGRALISRSGGPPESVQLAHSSTNTLGSTPHARASGNPPFRPWLDPLPKQVPLCDVDSSDGPGLAFGLLDLPREQRRSVAIYDPVEHGNLLVLGAQHSGKSTALAVLAQRARRSLIVPPSVEGAWDAVDSAMHLLRGGGEPTLVIVDDVDEVSGMLPAEHEAAFVDRLTRLAREGPRAGVALVVSAAGMRGRLQSISVLCESSIILRMPGKQEHVLAGGAPEDFDANMPAGGGVWRGQRVQVAFTEARQTQAQGTGAPFSALEPSELVLENGKPLVVVSSVPAAIRPQLERLGTLSMIGSEPRRPDGLDIASGSASVLLGDPDAWQGAWGLFTSLRTRCSVAFHECSASEFRSLSRRRELPLPVESPRTLVVLDTKGTMVRAALPG